MSIYSLVPYIYRICGISSKVSHYRYYYANYHVYGKSLNLLILFDIISSYNKPHKVHKPPVNTHIISLGNTHNSLILPLLFIKTQKSLTYLSVGEYFADGSSN